MFSIAFPIIQHKYTHHTWLPAFCEYIPRIKEKLLVGHSTTNKHQKRIHLLIIIINFPHSCSVSIFYVYLPFLNKVLYAVVCKGNSSRNKTIINANTTTTFEKLNFMIKFSHFVKGFPPGFSSLCV